MSRAKILYLLRHAKSSWDDPELADHDRPLAPRGARNAAALPAQLRARGISPELILCSSAQRARETLAGVLPALDTESEIRIEDDLYGAGAGQLIETLRAVPRSDRVGDGDRTQPRSRGARSATRRARVGSATPDRCPRNVRGQRRMAGARCRRCNARRPLHATRRLGGRGSCRSARPQSRALAARLVLAFDPGPPLLRKPRSRARRSRRLAPHPTLRRPARARRTVARRAVRHESASFLACSISLL